MSGWLRYFLLHQIRHQGALSITSHWEERVGSVLSLHTKDRSSWNKSSGTLPWIITEACKGLIKLLESLANLTTLILMTSPWFRSWSLLGSAGLHWLTYRRSATGLPGFLEGEAATAQKLSMFIIYNWTQRRGCCIQLNKKTGLAHLWRADSVGGTICRLSSSGGRKLW